MQARQGTVRGFDSDLQFYLHHAMDRCSFLCLTSSSRWKPCPVQEMAKRGLQSGWKDKPCIKEQPAASFQERERERQLQGAPPHCHQLLVRFLVWFLFWFPGSLSSFWSLLHRPWTAWHYFPEWQADACSAGTIQLLQPKPKPRHWTSRLAQMKHVSFHPRFNHSLIRSPS